MVISESHGGGLSSQVSYRSPMPHKLIPAGVEIEGPYSANCQYLSSSQAAEGPSHRGCFRREIEEARVKQGYVVFQEMAPNHICLGSNLLVRHLYCFLATYQSIRTVFTFSAFG